LVKVQYFIKLNVICNPTPVNSIKDNNDVFVSAITSSGSAMTSSGGSDIAGEKLREAGISHWQTPNTGATNESGFSAVPAFSNKVEFDNDGSAVNYWSVDYISGTGCRSWILSYNSDQIIQSFSEYSDNAFTVHCIKNK
jgi:uncharacterized protein (TIGR02145 family)